MFPAPEPSNALEQLEYFRTRGRRANLSVTIFAQEDFICSR
jgi:hypothetical protein